MDNSNCLDCLQLRSTTQLPRRSNLWQTPTRRIVPEISGQTRRRMLITFVTRNSRCRIPSRLKRTASRQNASIARRSAEIQQLKPIGAFRAGWDECSLGICLPLKEHGSVTDVISISVWYRTKVVIERGRWGSSDRTHQRGVSFQGTRGRSAIPPVRGGYPA